MGGQGVCVCGGGGVFLVPSDKKKWAQTMRQ